MELIVEFLGFIGEVFFMFGDGPDEQRIEKNIAALMAFSWFAELRKNPEYEELIRKNDSVRYVIGKMRMKRMKNSTMYEERKERRLMKELEKQLGGQVRA
ncbi:hypothetical protein [Guptibacillus hwajinpoensis]|uniref:Uncharacterized protein n=1 Tax=Guptibacillus hwajinpoensis TaxID=208199 RepID=A0A0J6CKC9_9BACL|nr:hypothetical protein [Alkalihalobacillus macyae]KMM36691.1 hypothetical protein AB986_12135 [Alkalihalobacillus macyae]